MTKIVFEEDAYLKCIPVILDPNTPDEHCRAVADWMSPPTCPISSVGYGAYEDNGLACFRRR